MVRTTQLIPGPLKLPFFGNLLQYKLGIYQISDYHNVLIKLHKRYGPIVKQFLGPGKPVIHIFDPDDVRQVYLKEGRIPHIEPLQTAVQQYRKNNLIALGLGNTNGEEWYRLRVAIKEKALVPKQVINYFPLTNDVTHSLIKRLKQDDAQKDLRCIIAKWNMEVAGRIFFGKHLGCFDGNNGEKSADKIYLANRISFKLSAKLKFSFPWNNWFNTPTWNQFVKSENFIYSYVFEEFKESVERYKKGDNNTDFLEHLLKNTNLTESEAGILIFSFFADGLSTTVPTLICNLHCLGSKKNIQNEVRKEVKNSLNEKGELTVDSLNQLKLLKACVKETFRFYPIGTDISRILPEDLILSGYHIPKGTHVNLNQFVHFQSEKYFYRPKEFEPLRWLDKSTSNIPSHLLLPFSHGFRSCAGRRIAEQDLYVSIAKIILNFEIDATPPLEQIYETLLFPKEPYSIKFKSIT